MGMVVWLWRGRAGYGGIWGDMEGGGEVMPPMTSFGVWGLSLSEVIDGDDYDKCGV